MKERKSSLLLQYAWCSKTFSFGFIWPNILMMKFSSEKEKKNLSWKGLWFDFTFTSYDDHMISHIPCDIDGWLPNIIVIIYH